MSFGIEHALLQRAEETFFLKKWTVKKNWTVFALSVLLSNLLAPEATVLFTAKSNIINPKGETSRKVLHIKTTTVIIVVTNWDIPFKHYQQNNKSHHQKLTFYHYHKHLSHEILESNILFLISRIFVEMVW